MLQWRQGLYYYPGSVESLAQQVRRQCVVCVCGEMGVVIITYSDTPHSVSFFSLCVCVLWCV